MRLWGKQYKDAKIEDMLGLTIERIVGEKGDSEIIFYTTDNRKFIMHHYQECCERVKIEDIIGELSDIIGQPLLMAEEVRSHENPEGVQYQYQDISFTWTFYKFATIKGYVTIRWYGESSGYYSECVDLVEVVATSTI